ncbi:hypothetical protein LY76DRAFT_211166 [Colletotrichum caudatum]|nr:hypothetical protein LY76DRAFT_211166 [Colletotrichum caudatum]
MPIPQLPKPCCTMMWLSFFLPLRSSFSVSLSPPPSPPPVCLSSSLCWLALMTQIFPPIPHILPPLPCATLHWYSVNKATKKGGKGGEYSPPSHVAHKTPASSCP